MDSKTCQKCLFVVLNASTFPTEKDKMLFQLEEVGSKLV